MSINKAFNELARFNWRRVDWQFNRLTTMWMDCDVRRDDVCRTIYEGNQKILSLLIDAGAKKEQDFFDGCYCRFESGFTRRCDVPYFVMLNPDIAGHIEQAREQYLNDNEICEGHLNQRQASAVESLAAFDWARTRKTGEIYIDWAGGNYQDSVMKLVGDGKKAEDVLVSAGFEVGEHFYFAGLQREKKAGSRMSTLHISPIYDWFGDMIMAEKKKHGPRP